MVCRADESKIETDLDEFVGLLQASGAIFVT